MLIECAYIPPVQVSTALLRYLLSVVVHEGSDDHLHYQEEVDDGVEAKEHERVFVFLEEDVVLEGEGLVEYLGEGGREGGRVRVGEGGEGGREGGREGNLHQT